MIVLEDGIVTVKINGNQDEHTKIFATILARMINKGINNPAYQLHALSLLATGKPIVELLEGNEVALEHLVAILSALSKGMIETMISDSPEKSSSTIDDFLKDR